MSLPDVQFATLDARQIETEVLTGFEEAARQAGISDYKLYDGDPRRLFLLTIAACIAQQNAIIDLTGKSNLLRYAGEDTIEDLGYLYGDRGARLKASRAVTTVRYTLSATRSTTIVIPKGSRVSPDGQILFATVEDLEIAPGNLTGKVMAACHEEGIIGNGFEVGQISTIVDRSPFVASAYNETVSAGGADLEDLESYRMRIYQAPESFSVAGPEGAYEFWAKSASAAISDVAVWSPDPGVVHIAPLLEGGEIPTQSVLDLVYETCNDRTVRPLTDLVEVVAPTPVEYRIEAEYFINRSDMALYASIQEAAEEAVNTYRQWQCAKLGRDIVPSKLIELVMAAGVKRVEVTSPVYQVLEPQEVAVCTDVSLIYGGLEDA